MNWTALSEAELPAWMDIANAQLASSGPQTHVCPSCGSTLRCFMHRRADSQRGGLWMWCPECGRHYHATCIVPAWWTNKADVVPEQLADPPEYLNSHWQRIDSQTPATPDS
jgi:ribosomal protein L37AE/L43A